MADTMNNKWHTGLGESASGDVIGATVGLVLGLLHLFVLQAGGTALVLLFVVWPLLGGMVGAYVEQTARRPARDLPVVGVLSGVFGAFAMAILVFLTGLAGVWSGFITSTFGVGLLPVTMVALMVFTITWAVFGYLGGTAVRTWAGRA